jgi:hypothetical protein
LKILLSSKTLMPKVGAGRVFLLVYRRGSGAKLQANEEQDVPHFIGIGAQKSATTWTFKNLSRHPSIAFPAGKEIHFWDRQCERGVDWYLGLFSSGETGVKQGEITPAYASLEAARIVEIAQACPDVRLFYSLRNPLERAWSSACMALERAEMTDADASDQWFVDHFRSAGSYELRGDYETCIKRWWSVFPAEQLLVVFHDDILIEPRHVLRRLARHIGTDGEFFDTVPEETLREPVFSQSPAPIRPTLIPVLRELYEARIDRLSALFGRDLSHWKNVAT